MAILPRACGWRRPSTTGGFGTSERCACIHSSYTIDTAIAVWGICLAPRAKRRLPEPWRFLAELVL